MDLRMTPEEREEFLADVHVGVMAIERADGPPLAVPIWYDYEPGGELAVIMGGGSLKHRLLSASGRFSLCAQDETLPYRYVSVEGEVTSNTENSIDHTRSMAHRYMGREMGDSYAESSSTEGSRRITMRPQHWYTLDYSKMG